MGRMNAPLYSLNQGEVSKQALGRVDVQSLRLAAGCQVNWMPWVIGPASLRPGLTFIGEVLSDLPTKLLSFVFSKLDTALIELTPNNMRIWVNEVLVQRVAVATTIPDGTFATGQAFNWDTSNTTSGAVVTIASGVCTLQCIPIGGLAQIQQDIAVASTDFNKEHGLRFVVTHGPVTVRAGSAFGKADLINQTTLDTGTHSLACTPTSSDIFLQVESTDAYNKSLTSITIDNPPSGPPIPLQIPTSFGLGDLQNVRADQSGDVVYLGIYGQQQAKIERRSTDGWSVATYHSDDGPFQQSPGITANFSPTQYYGDAFLNSDRPWFQPTHTGAMFRLFSTGQFNQAQLGNNNAYTQPVRVTGVGTTRNYTWTVTGTWTGTLTFQRSYDAPDSGFIDVSTVTVNGTISSSTGGTGGTPDLDNVIAWERVGFKGAGYGSGSAIVVSSYGGGGGFGICRVTSYNSATQVKIQILQPFSTTVATSDWLESDWSGVIGWPTSVSFHEGRLGWFGRDEIWLSSSDSFGGFAEIDNQGNPVGDAGPINVAMGSGPVDTISWGLSLTRLMLGREQSIASTRSSNFDQPLTPTSVVVRDCSDQGAERLPAVKAGKRGIFVQQSGRRIYELFFNAQEFDYDERDLTRLNLDIGKPGFTDIAKATQPDKMVWLPRADGQCAALLYDVKDEVNAFWRVQTLGVIENVCVLPSAGLEDLVYFVVRRTINGVTKRFIERLALRDNCVGGSINQQCDCQLIYQGALTSAIVLPQLPNTLVTVWADGSPIGTTTTDGSGVCTMPDGKQHSNIVAGLGGFVLVGSVNDMLDTGLPPNQIFKQNSATLTIGTKFNGYPVEVFADIGGTGEPIHIGSLPVTSGVVTLPNNQVASTIIACCGYVAPFMSAKLAYAAQLGSALTQKKKIDHIGLVMYDTHYQGITHGQRFDKLDSLPQMEADQPTAAGTVWSEYDEPMFELGGEWNTDSRLCLLAQAPVPCQVGGVVIAIQTNEKT